MLGRNYILSAVVSIAVLSLGTMVAADEYRSMFGLADVEAALAAPTKKNTAASATHPVVAPLDSAFTSVRAAFLPGSSAVQDAMEADLVHIVTLLRSANDVTIDVAWYEPDRAMAQERAENLRTRLQLYGLPPGRLRLAGQLGDPQHTLTPVSTR